MRSRGLLRSVSATIVGIAISSIGTSTATYAAAPTFIDSFETSPGIVRTSLTAVALDFDPGSGMLHAVAHIDGETRLVAVDLDRDPLFTTTEVVLASGRLDVADIDVSQDGRTVLVATGSRVDAYDVSTSALSSSTEIPGFSPDRVVASPDGPHRFLALAGSDRGVVVDGTTIRDLAETVDPADPGRILDSAGLATWDEAGDAVIVADENHLLRVSVDGPPEVMQAGPFVSNEPASSPTLQGPNLLFAGALVDVDTLAPIEQIATRSVMPTADGSTSFATHADIAFERVWTSIDANDRAAPALQWIFPFTQRVEEWVSLDDGRLAVLERSGDDTLSYLTLAEPEKLATAYGEFHPVDPVRVLDTRSGLGRGTTERLGPGSETTVQLAGRGGLPTTGVLAVVLNLTATGATEGSYFSIWPSGVARPVVSNLNFRAGQTLANFVTVGVGADGAVRLANEFGAAHGIIDVVGYYSTEASVRGARYVPVLDRRILDTRSASNGPGRPVGAGQTITVSIREARPFRDTRPVVAAVLNVTAVNPREAGFLSVTPQGTPGGAVSSINFAERETRANLVVVKVDPSILSVDIYNAFGSVDVVVDIVGVYSQSDLVLDQAGKFLATVPFRSFDSRVDSPYPDPGRLPENRSIIFSNSFGWTDIWNLTAVSPTSDGFLSVLGFDESDPSTVFPATSNVNFRAGENVANGVYAFGDPETEVYNPFGETHVVVDRFGYLTPQFQRPVEEVWAEPTG